jgi:hypothetical protein
MAVGTVTTDGDIACWGYNMYDQSSTWSKYDQTNVPSPGYLLPSYYDWGDCDTAGCSGGIDHASWGYEADQVLVR